MNEFIISIRKIADERQLTDDELAGVHQFVDKSTLPITELRDLINIISDVDGISERIEKLNNDLFGIK